MPCSTFNLAPSLFSAFSSSSFFFSVCVCQADLQPMDVVDALKQQIELELDNMDVGSEPSSAAAGNNNPDQWVIPGVDGMSGMGGGGGAQQVLRRALCTELVHDMHVLCSYFAIRALLGLVLEQAAGRAISTADKNGTLKLCREFLLAMRFKAYVCTTLEKMYALLFVTRDELLRTDAAVDANLAAEALGISATSENAPPGLFDSAAEEKKGSLCVCMHVCICVFPCSPFKRAANCFVLC
jgi:hypothetical protein